MTTPIETGAHLFLDGVDVGVVTGWTLNINTGWPTWGQPDRETDIEATTTEGTVRFRLRGGEARVDQANNRVTIDERLADIETRLTTLNAAAPAPALPQVGRRYAFTGLYAGGLIDATAFGELNRTYLAGWEPTPEQVAAAKARLKEVEAAKAKALKLLNSHLTPRQQASLKKRKSFEVQGAHIVYRIWLDGTVSTLNPSGTFCIYPVSPEKLDRDTELPPADRALTLKLFIEADEAEFLRVANWTGFLPDQEPAGYSLAKLDISGTSARQPSGGYEANVYGRTDIDGRRNAFTFDAGAYLGQMQTYLRPTTGITTLTTTTTTNTVVGTADLGTVGWQYTET